MTIEVCATCCLLSKLKVRITSSYSTKASNYHTGQSKGRYHEREHSITAIVVGGGAKVQLDHSYTFLTMPILTFTQSK